MALYGVPRRPTARPRKSFSIASTAVAATLAGTLSSAGTVTGKLTFPVPFSGTLAGASTVSGALKTTPVLAGALNASGTVSLEISTEPQIMGTLAGAATVNGTLSTSAPFATSGIEGSGSVTALLYCPVPTIYKNLLWSSGDPLVSETVKYVIHTYDGGDPENTGWMAREQSGTATTDEEGNITIVCESGTISGTEVYVSVIAPDDEPTESMIWNATLEAI